ncbi:sporulation protein YpjB [Massilibacterium senegalense]|uniref:sporulation protein YpjB n=1 Tax=Massilibacterium senegalense TaxID=1632858 RepID=UPI00078535D9|nr:sporulation protein YpjB [Massilibacterium senegalense]
MKKALFLIFILFFIGNGQLSSESEYIQKLVQHSDELYQMIRNNQFEQAKQLSQQIEKDWSSKHYSLTLKETKMLSFTFFQVKESLNQAALSKKECENRALQFRLVTDTLLTNYQPLWKESKINVIKQFEQCQQNSTECSIFLEQFSLLLPAISLDITEERYVRLQSYVAFIERLTKENGTKEYAGQMEEIKQELVLLFEQQEENSVDPGFIWFISMVGSFIILSLIYVGWKKYKGEQEAKKRKEKE